MFRFIFLLLSSSSVFSQTVSPPPDLSNSWTTEGLAKEFCEWQGVDGSQDLNRKHVSDPVLEALSGEVRGKVIGDFGSGCGYLSRKYAVAGARIVYSVEPSHWMNVEAKKRTPKEHLKTIKFLQESGSNPVSIKDNAVDIVISNYVLMDIDYIDAHARAMYRVLSAGGKAIIVVLHPIYTLKKKHSDLSKTDQMRAYFQEHIVNVTLKGMGRPIEVHHRWVSDYINSFTAAGLYLVDFEEPHLIDKQRRSLGLSEEVGSEPTSMILVFKKQPNQSKEQILNLVIDPDQSSDTDIRTELDKRVICKKLYGTPNWQSACMKFATENGIDVDKLSYSQLITTAFIVIELLKSSTDYETLFYFNPLAHEVLKEAIDRLKSAINAKGAEINTTDLQILQSAENYFGFQLCQLLQKSGHVLKYTFDSYRPWLGMFGAVVSASLSAYRSKRNEDLLGPAAAGFMTNYVGSIGLTWIVKPLRIAYGRDDGCDCTSCETDKSHSMFHDALRLVDLEK